MTNAEKLQAFEDKKVRTVWVDEEEKWFFSVLDVIEVLTDSKDPTDYFKKMRKREEGLAEFVGTNCPQVEMLTTTGKRRKTLAGEMSVILRIIESIPSKKAEPFKQWMASVASERIDQMIDPERSFDQAVADYRRLGYSEAWITQRIKTFEIRKGLTDEWKRGGVTREVDFAFLTDLMSKTWSGLTTREYKKFKGLTKENLRDNMTNMELLLNALAEQTATEISKARNPKGLGENAQVAQEGATVAKSAREEAEKRIGHSIVSPQKAIDNIRSPEELPFDQPEEQ